MCSFARSRRDFVISSASWLVMNRWFIVLEAPALHVLWHDGDDTESQRVCRCVGRNELLTAAEATEPLRIDAWRTTETVTEALAHVNFLFTSF